jgi:hypothetical protein
MKEQGNERQGLDDVEGGTSEVQGSTLEAKGYGGALRQAVARCWLAVAYYSQLCPLWPTTASYGRLPPPLARCCLLLAS